MADKNLSIDILAADKTAAAFASVKKGLGELDSKVEAVKGTFSAFAAIAGTVGLTDLFKEAVAAASQAEQSSNRLNAVLKATGNSVGFTREELDKMAVSLSKATQFDDEGIRDAQANLIKFGKVHGETFERALKLSADYAAFTGGTMVEATQLIGKALADPVNGATALGKALGHLTQTEQDAIQKFTSLGDSAHATEIILNKLEKSIGGTAGAMNTGLFGATTATTKAWDDFLKALGKTAPVQLVVTGGMNLITEGLNLITEAIDKQNKVWVHNPLLNGGKLQPLPEPGTDPLKALQGSGLTVNDVRKLPPGLRPSIVPQGQNALTADEVRARGASAAAEAEEKQQSLAEARKKLMKEMIPLADEIAHSYTEAAEKQKQAVQDILADYMQAQLKEKAEFEQMAEELGKSSVQAEQSQLAAASDMRIAFQEDEDARLGVLNRQQTVQRQVEILDSLRTAREIENQDWVEKQQILRERYLEDYNNRAFWYVKLWQLDRQHQKNLTDIEDAEIKKRFGIATVYRKADIDAAGFFFNTLSGLMQTKNRQLFEIGKAAAIAGAIIDTWKAATGAYAALASIPIVGPALGAAAAAAAVAVGFARVAAIKSTTFGSSSGAVGTFAANPSTGLPESPTSSGFESPAPVGATQTAVPQRKDINITLLGEGFFSASQIRDSLIPLLNDAVGDGVTLRATVLR